MKFHSLLSIFLLSGLAATAETQLRVPANTAYLEPLDGPAHISGREEDISGWTDPAQKILWGGELNLPGTLKCAVELRLPAGAQSKLRLTIDGKSREVTVQATNDSPVKADFGAFDFAASGYQKFTLESLNPAGKPAGRIEALVLSDRAAAGAHFNLKPRRNTASVHLAYPTRGVTNIDAFYCEVTPTVTPLWTYFEACGWHRGYFGMQVNSPTERRIIFSVWDSGNEAVSREKVGAADRVTLLGKGAGVFTGDFGNEGTGGHSHLVYDWKTGEKQRFLVTEKIADATHSIYSGYWFHPEQKKWMLISSWKAPKDGKYLSGLYSFVEDFNGENGQLNRKAFYGNQWYHTADGRWHEQTVATFSHDPTGEVDRLDRCMGVDNGRFFLSTGGFLPGSTKFGEKFSRSTTGEPPAGLPWP
jgi:hypothetical protein